MDLLKNQEELLKNKLEDAVTVTERRQIRGDLREIRRKMQEFDLNADENANTVPAKENMNTILPKRDLNSNITKTVSPSETDLKIQAKNSRNEAKTTSTDTKSAISKKSEQEYKINDDSVDLKVKSADERANRRAKRQERMARLAKEQTEEEHKETTVHKDKGLSSIEATTPKDAKNEVKESENSSSRYDAKRSDVKDTKFSSRSQPTEKSIDLKKTESNDDKKSSYSKPLRFEKKEESVTTTPVDTPKSFVKSTERKEERTFVQGGQKFGGVRQTIEEKTVTENGEKTTYTSRTNSRLSNSLDKFGGAAGRSQLNGSQGDKQKAAKAISNALNVGSIRDRFASAEKKAPTKPVDLGLNFARKIDQPGFTVKKYKEVKVEQKSTTSKPLEFGLSFGRDKGQQQTDTKSNLRETSTGSGYKKTTPVPHPRHQTAPAAPGGFGMPGGGAKASSVADRMKFFKQAQEQEKADAEKQKQKQEQRARLSSAPASTTSQSSTENRTAPCLKKRDVKKPVRRTMSISSIVLDWCKEMVKDYGVTINNFSGSWSSGLAFCALIHKFNPDKFDYKSLDVNDRHRNFTLAFDTAFEVKKIPKLLDVEDMVRMAKPEPRSVQCYVQWIWSVYGPTSGYGPSQDEIKQAAIG